MALLINSILKIALTLSYFLLVVLFINVQNLEMTTHAFQIRYIKPSGIYRPIKSSIRLHAVSPIDSNMNSNSPTKNVNFNRIKDLQEKLVKSGQAGLLAYGFLNCLYYISVTAVTWYITIQKFPFVIQNSATLVQRLQFILSRLGSVATTVWIGSQITKVFRLSGAVICAPFVDNLMEKCQKYFNLKSRNASFWFLIAAIWATVFVFYGSLILYGTSTLYLSV